MNSKYLTFYDFKMAQTSRIFEADEIQGYSPYQINEAEKLYDEVINRIQNNNALNEAIDDSDDKFNEILEKLNYGGTIDEGVLGGLAGGAAGALAGPAIGKAICKALGIDEKGHLGKLLTSRLVSTAIGAKLGLG